MLGSCPQEGTRLGHLGCHIIVFLDCRSKVIYLKNNTPKLQLQATGIVCESQECVSPEDPLPRWPPYYMVFFKKKKKISTVSF